MSIKWRGSRAGSCPKAANVLKTYTRGEAKLNEKWALPRFGCRHWDEPARPFQHPEKPMTDREMLLVAIREHPEEDTPRLAFADYLQERGNAYFEDWATLIRTQIEATKVERHSARWFELAQQQAELFEKRKLDWDPYSGSGLGCAAYRRGFREAIPFDCDAPNFSRHFDLAFAGNPLRAVRLNWNRKSGMREIFQGIARHPGMARVETLDVGNTPPKAARWLLNLAVRHTPRLRALGLSDLNLTATTAADLLVSVHPRTGRPRSEQQLTL